MADFSDSSLTDSPSSSRRSTAAREGRTFADAAGLGLASDSASSTGSEQGESASDSDSDSDAVSVPGSTAEIRQSDKNALVSDQIMVSTAEASTSQPSVSVARKLKVSLVAEYLRRAQQQQFKVKYRPSPSPSGTSGFSAAQGSTNITTQPEHPTARSETLLNLNHTPTSRIDTLPDFVKTNAKSKKRSKSPSAGPSIASSAAPHAVGDLASGLAHESLDNSQTMSAPSKSRTKSSKSTVSTADGPQAPVKRSRKSLGSSSIKKGPTQTPKAAGPSIPKNMTQVPLPSGPPVHCPVPSSRSLPVQEAPKFPVSQMAIPQGLDTSLTDPETQKSRRVRNWGCHARQVLTVSGYLITTRVWVGAMKSHLAESEPCKSRKTFMTSSASTDKPGYLSALMPANKAAESGSGSQIKVRPSSTRHDSRELVLPLLGSISASAAAGDLLRNPRVASGTNSQYKRKLPPMFGEDGLRIDRRSKAFRAAKDAARAEAGLDAEHSSQRSSMAPEFAD